MTIYRVRDYFKSHGIDKSILEFPVSSATVELASIALGCEPARIAKTLAFRDDDGAVLIVMAGDMKLDNSKYKSYFYVKARMLNPDEAIDILGYAPGGICPFDTRDGVKVYLDNSLKRFDTVFPACGTSNSAVELTPDELYEFTAAIEWLDVSKPL